MNGLCPYTSDDLSISVHNVAMGPVEILLVLVGPRCLRPRGVHGVAAGGPSSPLGPGPITGQDSRRGVIAPPGIMRKVGLYPHTGRCEPTTLMDVGPGLCAIRCSSTSFLNAQARFFA
jgi:hypothetical protein